MEIVTSSSPFVSDVKQMQFSLNKAENICIGDHPETCGCKEHCEGLRAKESDAIVLKSTITLPFDAKKKVEKKKFPKDLGACVVEVDLASNEVNNYVDGKESDGDFSDDDKYN